jgi:hypothetical protein
VIVFEAWWIAVPVGVFVVWLLWKYTGFHLELDPNDRFVHIEDEGAARALTADEREYLGMKFHGADGARPYIKGHYRERNGHGTLRGFLRRKHLPRRIPIAKS